MLVGMYMRTVTAGLLLATGAPAQLLIGVESGGQVSLIDPVSAERFAAGSLGAAIGIVGEVAIDLSSATVYASSTSQQSLWTCDLATGAVNLVGPYGGGVAYMHGIDYDVTTATLWGVPYSDNLLYAIDVNTGAATAVGPTGLQSFVNIAYDVAHDVLYAVDVGADALHTLDRATGAATLVGPLNGPTHAASLTYDLSSDTLFLADNQTVALYSVDRTTGQSTQIGSTGSGNLICLVARLQGGFRREAHGCGNVSLGFTGLPLLGDTLTFSVQQVVGTPFLGFGLQVGGFPFCACTVGHDWSAPLAGSVISLSIPAVPTFAGIEFGVQAADVLGPGCAAPAVGFSDSFVFVIG